MRARLRGCVRSTVGHGVLAASGAPLLRVTAAKGQRGAPLYDRWNSFSRVTVTERTSFPFSWGTTALYRPRNPVEQLWLEIDGHAGTPLTRFDGSFERLEHLGYDVVNAAHYLKRDASVLVIGSGGGRDVLAALAFGQRSVVAVEMNSHILDAANGRFGEFTGRLDRHPRVRFVNDEARSYARREPGRFDIIQASLIDTFAATAAGAFVLAEHSLYTVEAWETLLERLAPGGILTFGRWYHPPHLPIEAWRIVSLARASLEARNAPDPRANIVLVRNLPPPGGYSAAAVLVKNEPFSPQELDRLDEVSARIGFEVMLSPRGARDPVLASLARGIPPEGVPLDLEAPTDDRPFFFHVVRLSDLLRHRDWFGEKARWTAEPVFVLAGLLALVAGLAVLCIAAPLVFASERPALRRAWLPGVACAALGVGFMFVEISQMQRLVVFLGHPTYALSVVLFSLLVSSGAGSLLVQRLGDEGFDGSVRRAWGSLVIALVVFGACAPFVVDALRGAATPVRIAAGVTMLVPIGFFMGMAFPITLRESAGGDASLVAWLWAVNGATSVVGAVAAVALAMTIGISTVFWCGVLAYVAAAFAFLRAVGDSRRQPIAPGAPAGIGVASPRTVSRREARL